MQLDSRDGDRFETFTRRAAILALGTTGIFTGLAARMYYLQVVESTQYKMLAEENRVNRRLLTPLRGRILDRFGVDLAANRQNLRVVLVPEQTKDIDATLDALTKIVVVPESYRRRVKRAAARQARFIPVTVMENLSWEEFARINVRSPDLPGIHPEVGKARDYPYSDRLAHVIGYVAKPSDGDMKGDKDPLLQLPEFRIGKSGLEKTLDKNLRGRAGASHVEVNAYGRVIRELSRAEGQPGEDLSLTLDMEIQNFVYRRLEGQSAAVVVMDVKNGDIISIASAPAFDPNAFNKGLSQSEWDGLRNNKFKPLINKTIAGLYSPGSTFKTITALTALKSELVDPNERVFCGGKTRLGRREFHCWKKRGHGWMDMHNGIKNSCNVYFFDLARKIGIDQIYEMATQFGLGQTYDIGIPGEKPGLVPSNGWKQAVRGEPWVGGDTFNTAIGQGFLLTTPLQLAVMAARIANGKEAVSPRLVRSIGAKTETKDEKVKSLPIDPAWMSLVQQGMIAVMNEPGGTAFGSRLRGKGLSMAGKTGTVQVSRISRQERADGVVKNEDKPWERRDHGWFIGFGPIDNPRYAISVLVEHGGGGSKAAAPVARDIMREVLTRDPASLSNREVAVMTSLSQEEGGS